MLNQRNVVRIEDTTLAADIFISMVKGHTHLKCILGITKNVSTKDRDHIAREVARFFIKGYSL